jgi:(2Fe-2S) ferredoxin
MGNKEFLVQNILSPTAAQNLSKEALEKVSYFKKEKNDQPIIYIGAGTCGLGAGADKTIKAVRNYIETKKIEAEIVETGCIGLCSSEPLLDVKLPGLNRLSFEKVTEDKVENLLDSIFSMSLNGNKTLGQFKTENNKEWTDIQDISEHPFFKPQTRLY